MQKILTQANHLKIMIHAKNILTHVTHATHLTTKPTRFIRFYQEQEIYYSSEIYFIFRGYPSLSFNTMFIFTFDQSLGHIFVKNDIVETINKLKCKINIVQKQLLADVLQNRCS